MSDLKFWSFFKFQKTYLWGEGKLNFENKTKSLKVPEIVTWDNLKTQTKTGLWCFIRLNVNKLLTNKKIKIEKLENLLVLYIIRVLIYKKINKCKRTRQWDRNQRFPWGVSDKRDETTTSRRHEVDTKCRITSPRESCLSPWSALCTTVFKYRAKDI